MYNSNDIANLLKYCASSASEKLDWKIADNGNNEFKPMAKIESVNQLYQCIDCIVDNYSDIAEPNSLEGMGYCFNTFIGHTPHPIFTFASLYILLRGGAEIYINNTHMYNNGEFVSKNAYEFDLIIDRLVKVCSKVHVIPIVDKYNSDELKQFFANHPHISHVLDFADYANISERLKIYEEFNLTVHTPGSYLMITNYSEKGVQKNQVENIDKIGYMCFNGLLDYNAYRHDDNKLEDCYFGFDYGDLFWGYEAILNMWKDCKTKHDRQIVIIFTDKSKIKMRIRSDAFTQNKVILIEDFDCEHPVYDFKQLLL